MTGQAIGLGGDKLTLYGHPSEEIVEFRDGGWSAEDIAATWDSTLAPHRQPYGVELPPLELPT